MDNLLEGIDFLEDVDEVSASSTIPYMRPTSDKTLFLLEFLKQRVLNCLTSQKLLHIGGQVFPVSRDQVVHHLQSAINDVEEHRYCDLGYGPENVYRALDNSPAYNEAKQRLESQLIWENVTCNNVIDEFAIKILERNSPFWIVVGERRQTITASNANELLVHAKILSSLHSYICIEDKLEAINCSQQLWDVVMAPP